MKREGAPGSIPVHRFRAGAPRNLLCCSRDDGTCMTSCDGDLHLHAFALLAGSVDLFIAYTKTKPAAPTDYLSSCRKVIFSINNITRRQIILPIFLYMLDFCRYSVGDRQYFQYVHQVHLHFCRPRTPAFLVGQRTSCRSFVDRTIFLHRGTSFCTSSVHRFCQSAGTSFSFCTPDLHQSIIFYNLNVFCHRRAIGICHKCYRTSSGTPIVDVI